MNNKKNDRHTSEAYEKVVEHFHGNRMKADNWFHAENKFLGNKSPMKMIGENRADELNRFVDEKMRGRK
jgi:hypothetical protein